MIGLWLFLIIFAVIAMIYHMRNLNSIVEFHISHINPIEFCSDLERNVPYILLSQSAMIIFSLFVFKGAWPLVIINSIFVWFILRIKRKTHRVYDPMTIVRDCTKIRGYHIIAAFSDLAQAFYCLGLFLYYVIQNAKSQEQVNLN